MPTVEKPEAELMVLAPTPMSLLAAAVDRGASIDTIERLAKLQQEMLGHEARVAYASAMRRAQESMTRISADATNPQTHSKYASYAQLDRALRPLYSRQGFALSFDTGKTPLPDHMRVLCDVMHESGHVKTHHIDMPSDGKGAKGGDVMTKTHAAGTAASYGMRYLLKMIFNVAVGEDDKDGNTGGNTLAEELVVERLEWIAGARDLVELQRVFTNAYKFAETNKDKDAMTLFIRGKDERKKVLNASR